MEIWEPKPSGTLWTSPGLLRDCYPIDTKAARSWSVQRCLQNPVLTYDICNEFKSYDLQVYCRRTLCRHWNVIRRQSIVISRTKLLLQLGLSTSEIRYLLKYESPYTRNHHRTCQTIPKLTVFGVFFVLQISGSQRIPTDMRRVRKQWWTNIPGRPRLKKRWKIETGNSLRVSVCPLLPPQQVGDHLLVGTCLCWGVSPLSGVAAG